MPIATLIGYCCGTWFDSSSGDLIADLWKRTPTGGGDDKVIFAGPGSGHASDGNYNPLKDRDRSQEWKILTYGKAFLSNASNVPNVGLSGGAATALMVANLAFNVGKGLAFGDGMSKNVDFLMQWVDEAMSANDNKIVVNLVGWSRGGVTCHMAANMIQRKYGVAAPAVNIFAIDPVPGDANVDLLDMKNYYSEDYIKLPQCVTIYRSIIMSNAKMGFMPVVPEIALTTDMDVLYLPGDHSTPVKPVDGKPGPVELTRRLVEEFLSMSNVNLDGRAKATRMTEAIKPKQLQEKSERKVWHMGKTISLSESQKASAEMHKSGTGWGERLIEEMEKLPQF